MRAQVIWNKERMIISRGHYHWHHEPCWYAVRQGASGNWAGDRKQTTIASPDFSIVRRTPFRSTPTSLPCHFISLPATNTFSTLPVSIKTDAPDSEAEAAIAAAYSLHAMQSAYSSTAALNKMCAGLSLIYAPAPRRGQCWCSSARA